MYMDECRDKNIVFFNVYGFFNLHYSVHLDFFQSERQRFTLTLQKTIWNIRRFIR